MSPSIPSLPPPPAQTLVKYWGLDRKEGFIEFTYPLPLEVGQSGISITSRLNCLS